MSTPSNADQVLRAADTAVASEDADLSAANVTWDISTLLDGQGIEDWLETADGLAGQIEQYRGRVGSLPVEDAIALHQLNAQLGSALSRVGHFAMLAFSEDTTDPERGATMARVQERSTAIATRTLFVELEWADADEAYVQELLEHEGLAFCRHHLRTLRAQRRYLLTEPEERILTEKSVTGVGAWVRLFDELTSSIQVRLDPDGDPMGLEQGLSKLAHPDRPVRAHAAAAVSEALEPGIRTRAFVYNTILADKATDDRLRAFPSWISSRNLANEASDESVDALVAAVVARYDIPQRWYRLKADILGLDRLADYDRSASVATSDRSVGWSEATRIVRDAYGSFSPELAHVVGRFIDEGWIDAPVRPGKRPGAFCAYTVPEHHPYVLLNWTGRSRDVSTLAHELGHGVHAYLAREQGIFHQSTPLTLAETASVFGETVTNNALLAAMDDPAERFALLATTLEDSIATVFRQIAMNRFEAACHTARRETGELSVEQFGEHWFETQTAMLGEAVEITEGYRMWWSYIPHFIGTPGYVYAYAYGQLLALSVYARYLERGEAFVPAYLDLLRAGGSMSPTELGKIVDCDLNDPGFWDAGLSIVEAQLEAAIEAANAAGRLG